MIEKQQGGIQTFDIRSLDLNADGTLAAIPSVEVVPASMIKTAALGGIIIQKGQELTFTESRIEMENAMGYLDFSLKNAVHNNRRLSAIIDEKERELSAAKATSLLGEHTLFPLNADGVPTPPDSPDCFCYLVFPNMKRRILICNLPANAGETLRFGDLASLGYSVVIERRAKASPIPGGKPSMGYSLSIENRAGQNCDIEFVPDHAFHERLSDHQKNPIFMGGNVFRGTFQMKRYVSYSDSLAMLLRDEMIEVLRRDGWKSPQEVADKLSVARQLPTVSTAAQNQATSGTAQPGFHDEDRIRTKPLPVARPPAPPPAAIAASVNGAKSSTPPPKDPAAPPDSDSAELRLVEEEVIVPAGEPEGAQPPAVAAPTN